MVKEEYLQRVNIIFTLLFLWCCLEPSIKSFRGLQAFRSISSVLIETLMCFQHVWDGLVVLQENILVILEACEAAHQNPFHVIHPLRSACFEIQQVFRCLEASWQKILHVIHYLGIKSFLQFLFPADFGIFRPVSVVGRPCCPEPVEGSF